MPPTKVIQRSESIFEVGLRALLSLLALILLGGVLVSVAFAGKELWHCLMAFIQHRSMHHPLQELLISSLMVLAFVEVFRTAMAYFVEGRVKVTYLVDTVLVALLTEVLAFWYREVEAQRIWLMIALVLSLFIVRILAIRFSPNRRAMSEGL